MEIDRLIFIMSETEAKTFGRFLSEILTNLGRWHADRSIYEDEACGDRLPGFQKKWGPVSGKVNKDDVLDFEDFRHALFKWHIVLYRVRHLQSGWYMLYCMVLVLTTIHQSMYR